VGLSLAERIAGVQDRIAGAAARSGRSAADITLIAVSKTVSRQVVDEAYALGLRDFGENRVLDCVDKYAAPLPADARLHLIGQLQTNKAKAATDLFQVIHSVDRSSLISALEKQAVAKQRQIDVLLQVNVAGEEQKAGCAPEDACSLLRELQATTSLRVLGLMAMAPLVDDPEVARPAFVALRDLRDRLAAELRIALPWLSMGMTNDFEVAIEEGATHVRVGRAIFEGS
jgi:pyridoxal phosphate enzyme (YggS family)